MATINENVLVTRYEPWLANIVKTEKCPLCGSELRLRRVFDDRGTIDQNVIELFDTAGHAFPLTRPFLLKIRKEKQWSKLDALSTSL